MAEVNRLKWIEGDDSLKPPYGDFEEPTATDAPTTEDASTKDADAAAALAAAAGRDSYGTTDTDSEADTTTPSPDTESTQTPLVRKHTAEAEAAASELWRAVQAATGPQCYLAYHDGGYSNNKKTGEETAGWGYQL
eukprot:SAG31_NODE_20427_length_574_cov_15.341053_1_plen_135_part_01